jgi:hypothetical protein
MEYKTLNNLEKEIRKSLLFTSKKLLHTLNKKYFELLIFLTLMQHRCLNIITPDLIGMLLL